MVMQVVVCPPEPHQGLCQHVGAQRAPAARRGPVLLPHQLVQHLHAVAQDVGGGRGRAGDAAVERVAPRDRPARRRSVAPPRRYITIITAFATAGTAGTAAAVVFDGRRLSGRPAGRPPGRLGGLREWQDDVVLHGLRDRVRQQVCEGLCEWGGGREGSDRVVII